MGGHQRGKGGKNKKYQGRNNRPSREKYWHNRVLEERKVKQLMRHSTMTRAQALDYWRRVRKTRTKFTISYV